VDQYLGAAANGGNPNDFGGMQPDVFIKKRFGNFRATAVMDLEIGNRGPMAIREYGLRLFNAPGSEVQVFVSIKLYLKRASNDATNPRYFQLNQPSALAMMWERNALGNIVCTSAIDFGVSPVSPQSIAAFARVRAGCLQGNWECASAPSSSSGLACCACSLLMPSGEAWLMEMELPFSSCRRGGLLSAGFAANFREVAYETQPPVSTPAIPAQKSRLSASANNSNCTSMVNGNLTLF